MSNLEATINHITSRLEELKDDADRLKTRIGYMMDIVKTIDSIEESQHLADLPGDLLVAQESTQSVIDDLYEVSRDLERYERNR